MSLPASTYRVQFSAQFTFEDFEKLLGYLHRLGIGSIYASPILKSREGSSHGYDGLDPYSLDPEIGTLEEFKNIGKELREKEMYWIQDIVPNHMAYAPANPWLADLLELGPASKYYRYFDINWNSSGKVMAPILGEPLEQVMDKEELTLSFSEKGFALKYYDHFLPLSARSYGLVLDGLDFDGWEEKFKNFSGGQMEWEDLKINFYREVQENPSWEPQISNTVAGDQLRRIIDLQYFEPVHWQLTEKEINYRRFFTINDLICLRMEEEEVFEEYHYFLKELADSGLIQGLRIDHIDGLFSPPAYLRHLRRKFGDESYVVVEKILESEEHLPEDWPVQGSTGYEFLALVNQLFIDGKNENYFTKGYKELATELPPYEQLVFEKKSDILKQKMGGELDNLVELLFDLDLLGTQAGDQKENWKAALAGLLICFPVYRIYPESFSFTQEQNQVVEVAFERAEELVPERAEELKFLKKLFLGEAVAEREKQLYFLQRCQQFTGPLTAKGVEDTVFYIYNRLISQNEVGDSPGRFGITISTFHQRMKMRQEAHPFSLNATATHDTKRGEDTRMRINVLSELPEEWFLKVGEWREINSSFRKDGKIPDANEEYFIYQSLIGGFPFEEEEIEALEKRLQEYLRKALREAKVHSNWTEPDEGYERAVSDFVSGIMTNRDFGRSFDTFLEKIAFYGAIKSLGQVLLKITAPGIPDMYQGTELWDLSFVDPDNRRPVDYSLRELYVKETQAAEPDDLNEKIKEWLAGFKDGRIKLLLCTVALIFRKEHRELFERGEYLPLDVKGAPKDEILAFARRYQDQWVLVVIPILVTEVFSTPNFQVKETLFEIILPKEAPSHWRSVVTGKELTTEKALSITSILKNFPVGLLTNSR